MLTLGSEGRRRVPDFRCAPIRPANAQPKLAAFIDRFSPGGCFGLYLRAYKTPGNPAPPLVGTGALDAGSGAAAEAGLAVAAEMLSHITGDELPEELAPPVTIGEATRLFHWTNGAYVAGLSRGSEFGSFLVWRSGNVLGAVFVGVGSTAANDRDAVELAHRQQAHLEHPTPYTAAERYDLEVLLDDPALKILIYWLGRTFDPGHGLAEAFARVQGPQAQLVGPRGMEAIPLNRARAQAAHLALHRINRPNPRRRQRHDLRRLRPRLRRLPRSPTGSLLRLRPHRRHGHGGQLRRL